MSDKFRRIGALAGVAVLFGIYVVTLISAILQKESTGGLFIASLYCTFVVPVWVFVLQAIYNRTHKDAIGKAELKKLANEKDAAEGTAEKTGEAAEEAAEKTAEAATDSAAENATEEGTDK